MYSLSDSSSIDLLQENPGVYKIYWIENGQPKPIGRLAGEDESGVLYIGEGKNLKRRINGFRKIAIEDKATGHNSARKLQKLRVLSEMIDREHLFFTFEYCENHKDREREEISAYRQKFGEVPPLNDKASSLRNEP